MLKDFRVTAEEGLHETERTDRPSVMVAPDKEKGACCEQGSRQKKPGPSPEWHGQSLAQFTKPNDEHQYAGEVMIELRVSDACYGPFPSSPVIRSPVMFVSVLTSSCTDD